MGLSWLGFRSWYAAKQPDVVLWGKRNLKRKKKKRKKPPQVWERAIKHMKVCGTMPKAKEYFTKTTTPVTCYYLCYG